jgi:signal transduction histidine kinase/DNA-binding response OmpR family regulator
MASQLEEFGDFISFTVYDRTEPVANYGQAINHDVFLSEIDYTQPAFNGESLLSSAHYNGADGEFVIHVFVPMKPGRILSATIPGMLFSDIISKYRLWQTGSIFIVDAEGTFIASYRNDMVLEQRNLIEESRADPKLESAGRFYLSMISGNKASGRYMYDGLDRLCVYKRVSGSIAGWHIGVTVPLNESPMENLRNRLLLSTLLLLAIGVIVSVFASSVVVKPFRTIQKQAAQIQAALNEATRANNAKSSFLANMSHEMRTPLNAIIGLTNLSLESEKPDGEYYANLEKINNAGMTLLSTVNDILDISKIETGKLELVPSVYETPSLINDIATQSVMHKGEKPIKFILDINENLPLYLYGDELRIKQIFNNLLSNAFKYTREGTIVLSVKSTREDDTVRVSVSVRDTGIGIRYEDIENIFDDYLQTDMQTNRKIMGTGLGLAITKRLIVMMNGTISVQSDYGKGSVFTISFPQEFVSDSVIGPAVASNLKNFSYSEQKRRQDAALVRIRLPYARVLIVDDMVTNLDVAKGLMKPYGMQIDCVTSGPQAIEAIRDEKTRYSAIFMDHMMPDMDGIEATRLIRELGTDYAKSIPVIALTANAVMGNEEMFLRNDFQAFISKPIEIPRLDCVIRRWVRDKSKETGYMGDDDEYTCSPDSKSSILELITDGIDVKKGLERFGGDESIYLDALRSFAANIPSYLDTIKNVTRENLDCYTITVHGIKGSSLSICAAAVGDSAQALENAAKAGRIDIVIDENPKFIEAVERLISDLKAALEINGANNTKPKKDAPDADVLEKLLEACENYDMDGVDAQISELCRYEYTADGGLAAWLLENAADTNFPQIIKELSDLCVEGGSTNVKYAEQDYSCR